MDSLLANYQIPKNIFKITIAWYQSSHVRKLLHKQNSNKFQQQ